jgi:hypothetical protein
LIDIKAKKEKLNEKTMALATRVYEEASKKLKKKTRTNQTTLKIKMKL